ncbi:MAG: hypothetical protein AAB921_00645 [Patescibacteria group bacterium]
MQGVLLAPGKPGAVRIIRHERQNVLEIGCFRPTTHKDFARGKLHLTGEMGAVSQLVSGHRRTARTAVSIISVEMAVAMYRALGACLTKEEIENTITRGM